MFDTSLHLLKGIDGRGCFDIDLKYLKLNCDIVRMILSGDKTQIRVLVKQANSQDEDPADQYEAGDVIAVKETWAVKDGKLAVAQQQMQAIVGRMQQAAATNQA